MTRAPTERIYVRMALDYAMEWEKSLLEAHGTHPSNREASERCKRNIAAFERIRIRYFGPKPVREEGKMVSIYDLMRGS